MKVLFAFVFILLLLFVGCTNETEIVKTNATKDLYEIIKTQNYFDIYPQRLNEQDYQGCTGLRFIIIDDETKEPVKSNGIVYVGTSSTFFGVSEENRTDCISKISDNTTITVRLYAKGYSPLSFNVTGLPNTINTLKVSLLKSCTTGPSCFDNIAIEGKNVSFAKGYVRDIFIKKFNVSDFEFKCIECSIDRSGFIKGIATTPEAGDFEFYHRWGWCSSGGADCSDTRCLLTSNAELYGEFKDFVCANIYSRSYFDETKNECTNNLVYDNTTKVRKACVQGAYSDYKNGINSISLMTISSMCTSSAKKMNTDCLEN